MDNATWVAASRVPNAGDISVVIQNTHTVTVDVNSTAPNLIIDSGGVLATSSTFTLSVLGTTNVTGTLTLAGTGA
ncbi:MAG: hypothetical protein EBS55_09995, partial [Flavobacteriaceae bacterium]|nr:hypothetical protein [Flavobacteriaceae bacterium]